VAVDEAVIPSSVDNPDAADFIESVRLHHAVEAVVYGTDDLTLSAREHLPYWRSTASPRRLFVVREGGRIVARAMYNTQLEDPTTVWTSLHVLPDARGRGVGSELAAHLEALARGEGRSKVIAHAASRDAPGGRLDSPTGFGGLPLGNPEVQFLLGRGYRLEQVERASRLPLPTEVVVPHPGADYRLHEWSGPVPDAWLTDMAVLMTRLSTDAPSAGLERSADVFTPERIRAREAEETASPRVGLVVAVEHVPSGRLVGHTTVYVPSELERPILQYDTLVLSEHRGNRLGYLLKVANLDHLQRTRPGHPSVITFNAEENRFMLDINEQLGFTPLGYEGAWLKRL